jgi:hypothetical protein
MGFRRQIGSDLHCDRQAIQCGAHCLPVSGCIPSLQGANNGQVFVWSLGHAAHDPAGETHGQPQAGFGTLRIGLLVYCVWMWPGMLSLRPPFSIVP